MPTEPFQLPEALASLVLHGREERNLEFKSSMPWIASKFKVVKAVLAMANVKDGGAIVIGVEKDGQAKGMLRADLDTYDQDHAQRLINEYADPFVEITLSKGSVADGRTFVVVQVQEFADIPVVCRKNGEELRDGVVYSRSRRVYESHPVASQNEMRELLDLAVDKQIRRLRSRGLLENQGRLPQEMTDELFTAELQGL